MAAPWQFAMHHHYPRSAVPWNAVWRRPVDLPGGKQLHGHRLGLPGEAAGGASRAGGGLGLLRRRAQQAQPRGGRADGGGHGSAEKRGWDCCYSRRLGLVSVTVGSSLHGWPWLTQHLLDCPVPRPFRSLGTVSLTRTQGPLPRIVACVLLCLLSALSLSLHCCCLVSLSFFLSYTLDPTESNPVHSPGERKKERRQEGK